MPRRTPPVPREIREQRRDEGRAARRAQLLHDAIAAIRRIGPHVTMDDLARAGGVSKPIVYRRFGDRDGLVAAIGERFADNMLAEVQASLASDHDPRTMLRSTVDAYLAYIEREPHLYRFLMRQSAPNTALAAPRGGPSAVVVDVSRRVAAVIARQLRASGLDDEPAEPWAYGIVGMVYLVGDWWLQDPTLPRERLVDHLTSLLWDGFGGQSALAQVPVTVAERARP